MTYPVRIRIDCAYAGDPETRTYADSTFAEAVAALQGKHVVSQADGSYGYHRRTNVYIVATYATDHTEHHGPKRQIEREAGEPVFGHEVTINGRDISFGAARDAGLSWASPGALATGEAAQMIDLMTLALQIAKAANAEPFCPGCQPELAEYAARREARNRQSTAASKTQGE